MRGKRETPTLSPDFLSSWQSGKPTNVTFSEVGNRPMLLFQKLLWPVKSHIVITEPFDSDELLLKSLGFLETWLWLHLVREPSNGTKDKRKSNGIRLGRRGLADWLLKSVGIHFWLSVSQERTSSKIHGPKMEHEMEQAPVARKPGIIAFTTNADPCELSFEEVEQACPNRRTNNKPTRTHFWRTVRRGRSNKLTSY